MKKITKMMVLALTLVMAMSVGVGTTAEAAKKTTKVSKVASVDKLTSKKTITLTKGKKATLKTTVTASKKKYKAVTYKSSNKKVATVSSKGVITAKKAGKATITVTSKTNKKKKAKVTVKVVSGKVTKVKLTKKVSEMTVGDSYTFKATVSSKGKKPNKTVKWTTSNSSVATVSGKGVVTAKKAGTVTIKATSTDGTKKSASCKITVKAAPTTVVTPKDATNVAVTVAFKADTTVEKIQEDADKVAAFSNDKEVVVTLDGKTYTAKVVDGHVTLNGKKISDSEQAKKAKSVEVKFNIKADKIAAVTAFVPASVDSVTYGTVKFTDITATSFKVGDKTYTYVVDGKNIVIDGDVAADFKALENVATITVK